MSTVIHWNDARPPMTEGENQAAGMLAMIARQVDLASITAANRREWIWRYVFVQESAGRRCCGKRGYEKSLDDISTWLTRFESATLDGRVVEQDREAFVAEHVRRRTEAVREQADAIASEMLELVLD